MKSWGSMLSLMSLLFVSGCYGLILRIRHHDGKLRRVNLSQHSNFNDLYNAVANAGDIRVFDTDKIKFGCQEEQILTLRNNSTKLSEAHISNGDVLNIVSSSENEQHKWAKKPRLASSLLREKMKKVGMQRDVRTLADMERELSLLVKISRQEPNENVSVTVSGGVANQLREWKEMSKMNKLQKSSVVLFGKLDTVNASHVNLEVLAAVEIGLDAGSPSLDVSSRAILNRAVAVSRKVGLIAIGCCCQSDLPVSVNPLPSAQLHPVWSGRRGRKGALTNPQPLATSSSPSPQDIYTGLTLLSVLRTDEEIAPHPFVLLMSSVDSEGRDEEGGRGAKFEAFHFSDQALALHRSGVLSVETAVGAAASQDPHLVSLTSAVLLPNAVESTRVDSQLLVVPLRIRASSGSAASAWAHTFPSLAQMQRSDKAVDSARLYLRRVLSRIVGESAGSSKALDAVSRLQDLNLLLYLSFLVDEAVLAELCGDLLLLPEQRAASGTATLSPAVALALEQLLHSLPADP